MKFRKRPVIIDAVKFEYTDIGVKALKEFAGDNVGVISKARHAGALAEAHILTLEDGKDNIVKHVATEGDWVIRGVKGEFYPCKPDIFEATYEEAS